MKAVLISIKPKGGTCKDSLNVEGLPARRSHGAMWRN